MDNNDILKKLRVALHLRDDEIVAILKLVDFNVTRSELNALFRNEDDPRYKECGDQLLRNFLNGLVIHMRGKKEDMVPPKKPIAIVPKEEFIVGGNSPSEDLNPRQRVKTVRKHLKPKK